MDYDFWFRFRFIKKVKPFTLEDTVAVYCLHEQSKTVEHNDAFVPEIVKVMKHYEPSLSRWQKCWLWVTRRHRKARMHGSHAVSNLKNRQIHSAIISLIKAFFIWPFVVVDFYSFSFAFKQLTDRGQKSPEIWPEWPIE